MPPHQRPRAASGCWLISTSAACLAHFQEKASGPELYVHAGSSWYHIVDSELRDKGGAPTDTATILNPHFAGKLLFIFQEAGKM